MAVELLAWAHRDAVPFFDRASRPLAAGQLGDADDALVTDFDYDDYATLLWPGADLDALMQLRPLPTDPAHIMAELDGTASRVERVARWVWDTYGACIDEYGIDGTLAGESDDHDAGDDE
ncbi:MAG: hypothetical protein WCI22_17355 [Actinomycetota bacterium]